jgi:hypothetical protein
MFKSILEILSFVTKIFDISGYKARRKLKADKELADAIKNSDGERLARLKKLRDAAKIMLVGLFIASCASMRVDDIPLTEGEIPFKLPPGIYEDVDGESHNVSDERWSVSEAELFKSVVAESEFDWTKSSLIAALVVMTSAFSVLMLKKKS